jgi:hypothetical protein
MKKLPLLTAAAGLVTVFGAADAMAQCQDCVPDDYSGGMMCWSGDGGYYGACVEKVQYDGSGEEIPGSKYCYVTPCDDYGYYGYYGGWYSYNYDDWWWRSCWFCAE